jgi:hypothetical protein
MNRLPVLRDELVFLEKHLPELELRPDLGQLAADFKERIDAIRKQIRALEENK